jgi:hypothetical protein
MVVRDGFGHICTTFAFRVKWSGSFWPHLHHYLYLGFWDVDCIDVVLAMQIGMLTMGCVCDRLHIWTTFASHLHLRQIGRGHFAHLHYGISFMRSWWELTLRSALCICCYLTNVVYGSGGLGCCHMGDSPSRFWESVYFIMVRYVSCGAWRRDYVRQGLIIVYGKQLGLGYLLLGFSSSRFLVFNLRVQVFTFQLLSEQRGWLPSKDRLLLTRVQEWCLWNYSR